MFKKFPVFIQDHWFRKTWDIILILFIFITALIIPYHLVSGHDHFDFVYWLITIIFFIDILINFNTSIKVKLNVLKERKDIVAYYLKGWFTFDLLAAIPFAAIIVSIAGAPVEKTLFYKILVVLRLIRLFKLVKIGNLFQELQDYLNIAPGLMRLIIFIFWFTLVAHLMALGWIVIGAADTTSATGTVRSFGDQYLRALYWCVTTIATIGYGDYYPNHEINKQIIYTLFVQIIGVGMFGYIIGNIATLIANIDVAKANFMEKMEEIKDYMRIRKIPSEIQEKVRNYYYYLWDTKKSTSGVSFVDEIPHTLKMEILLHLNRNILDKVSLFKDMDEVFIREVIQLLEPLVFLPEDFIIRQGEIGDCMYFLSAGEVEVVVNGTRVARLGAGSPFGETALLQDERRTASIQTCSYCDVYKLSKQSFDKLRGKYSEFDRKVKEIMDQRMKDTAQKTHSSG